MNLYKADLHIHTVLSPCGDLNMSPVNIVDEAVRKDLDMIAITDHNTTRHCKLSMELGREHGLIVIPGCEITSKEEVHCLTLFENIEKLNEFQLFIDKFLVKIPHNPDKMGYQVEVNREEMIVYEEKNSLFSVVSKSVEDISEMTHRLEGIFIPAHINKPTNSLLSQLGFIPPDLNYDALEIRPDIDFPDREMICGSSPVIYSSDAHYIEDIAKRISQFMLESFSFSELKKAFKGEEGRKVLAG